MSRTVSIVAFVAVAWVPALGQDGYGTPREAALQFALANGVTLPTKDVVVAHESAFRSIDRPPTFTLEQMQAGARDMAKVVGLEARAGSAAESLTCAGSGCIPVSRPVIVVNEPEANGGGALVYIQVFLPKEKPEQQYDGVKWIAVVQVEQRNGRWVAKGFHLGPSKVGVRLGK